MGQSLVERVCKIQVMISASLCVLSCNLYQKKDTELSEVESCHYRKDGSVWTGERCVSPDETEDAVLCRKVAGSSWDILSQKCRLPAGESDCQKSDKGLVWDGRACINREEPENFYRYCHRFTSHSSGVKNTLTALRDTFGGGSGDTCQSIQTALSGADSVFLPEAGVEDLEAFTFFPGLRSLELEKNNIRDLNPLVRLPEILSLSLGSNRISDLSPLKNLTKLQKLILNRNSIADVGPLGELKELRLLDLSENPLIKDFSPVEGREFPEGFYK